MRPTMLCGIAMFFGAFSSEAEAGLPPLGAPASGGAWAGASVPFPPPERLIEWKPGVPGGIPAVAVAAKLAPPELPADGKTDISAVLQKAIDGVKAPGAVLLPPGTFLVTARVKLKSGVVLRGAGLDKTHLIVNAPSSTGAGAFEARGGKGSKEYPIASGASFGSRQLTMASAEGLKQGALVWIYCDDDAALMFTKKEWDTNWGKFSMGQIVRLASVAGATVTLDTPLWLDYKPALKPRLRELTPVTGIGFEDLHIKREDKADDAIICFVYADNCWVRGCETENCSTSHISVAWGRQMTVENCYIHDASNHGGGGHGYGVSLGHCVSDSLVQNCLFHSLRHAMIIQCGVVGTVYAHNYSFDTIGSDDAGKQWFHSNDISIHGHYAYASLFEGNVAQRAGIGDYWGPAGPRMTLFRNRIAAPEKARDLEHYTKLGIKRMQMTIYAKDSSHRATIVGNTLTEDATLTVDKSCQDVYVEGNLVGGQMKWNQAQPSPLPASLFLKSKPAYWGDKPWPCIGADVDAQNMTTLPAQDWHARIKQAGRPVPFGAADEKKK